MIALDVGDKIRGDASTAAVVDYTAHGFVATVITQLADGQLAATETDIYAAAAVVAITSIILVNTDTVARTVNLYLLPAAGTSRRLIPKNLQLEPGYSLHFDGAKISVLDTSGRLLTDSVAAWLDQALKTTSSPTFADLTDSGLTASLPVFSDALKKLATKSVADTLTALGLPVSNYFLTLATTVTSASDIAEYSLISQAVTLAGTYLILGSLGAYGPGVTANIVPSIRTGSGTFGSATIRARKVNIPSGAAEVADMTVWCIQALTAGDYVHLGGGVYSSAGNRIIYGNDDGNNKQSTSLTIVRIGP